MDNSINGEPSDDNHPQSKAGCGCNDPTVISITVTPTTGGQFIVQMARNDTVDNMKRIISKKLKVSRERICLLHRERQLKEGTLEENELTDGSRLTLLPIVETGLTAQKPELSVMNALESLNEAQVNDFLSGKAPLNLTMRLGDHMMLIQLMLSTFSNQNRARKEEKKSQPHLERILTESGKTAETSASAGDVTATVSRLAVDPRPQQRAECTKTSCACNTCPRLVSACTLDSVALSEATRNLTQTLKKLSSEVLTSKRVASAAQKYKNVGSGVMHYKRKPNAIIENMEHHGRGIYSGTFSGTLNPALQDRFGRPKKDVSTIIHILNDLLCAGPRPHCRKASCACNGASTSTASSSADSTLLSFVTADKQPSNIVQVPACSSVTVLPSNVPDAFSKDNENQTTRNKMKQLKSIMEERKEKRKAKRFSPYEKSFSCLDLISSNVESAESWATGASDSAIHATKSNDTIEPDPSPSIHSEPVIA